MVNIAILGFGIIGNGVADLISQNYELIKKQINSDINIKYIVDIKDFKGHPLEHKIVKDYNIVLNDPDVSIVVEMIGGSHPAYEFSMAALKANKNVITSNKEAVVNFGDSLTAAAYENNVRYLFEASVGGGVPIIRPLGTSLSGNDIYEITAILNGTSNYILTQMSEYGKSMDECLKEAQSKGYAESDPSADIDGIDTCRKICILAGSAFGTLIPPDLIKISGIRDITPEDIKNAAKNNYAIKLLGRAVKLNNGKIHISVAPYKVKADNLLANVKDVYNGIVIKGNAVGDVMFHGRGAGSLPTASAILSDIIDVVNNSDKSPNSKKVCWHKDIEGKYYEPNLPFETDKETREFLGEEFN